MRGSHRSATTCAAPSAIRLHRSPTPQASSSWPLVRCNTCGLEVCRYVSSSVENPGRVYFKCRNYTGKYSQCKFYLWEEDYQQFLMGRGLIKIHAMGSNSSSQEDNIKDDEGRKKDDELMAMLQNFSEQSFSVMHALEEINKEVKKQTDYIKLTAYSVAFFVPVVMAMLAVMVAKSLA